MMERIQLWKSPKYSYLVDTHLEQLESFPDIRLANETWSYGGGETMPVITLTWQPLYRAYLKQYGVNASIHIVQWRRNAANGVELAKTTGGLYITETVAGDVIYAGESLGSFRGRFAARANALREVGLTAGGNVDQLVPVLNTFIWRLATVDPANYVLAAEKWLIRFLYVRDQALALPQQRVFQNINQTKGLPVPNLTINNRHYRE